MGGEAVETRETTRMGMRAPPRGGGEVPLGPYYQERLPLAGLRRVAEREARNDVPHTRRVHTRCGEGQGRRCNRAGASGRGTHWAVFEGAACRPWPLTSQGNHSREGQRCRCALGRRWDTRARSYYGHLGNGLGHGATAGKWTVPTIARRGKAVLAYETLLSTVEM